MPTFRDMAPEQRALMQAKSKATQAAKRAAAQEAEAAKQAAPSPAAAAAGVEALIQGLATQMASLAAEVAALKGATPRFVPQVGPERPIRSDMLLASLDTPGERSGHRSIPMGPGGEEVTQWHMRAFPQRFVQGSLVRINRESTRYGSDKTWGEVLGDETPQPCPNEVQQGKGKVRCPGAIVVGGGACQVCDLGCSVLRVRWLSKTGHWKYVVRVPGLTRPTGDGFYDFELEAA